MGLCRARGEGGWQFRRRKLCPEPPVTPWSAGWSDADDADSRGPRPDALEQRLAFGGPLSTLCCFSPQAAPFSPFPAVSRSSLPRKEVFGCLFRSSLFGPHLGPPTHMSFIAGRETPSSGRPVNTCGCFGIAIVSDPGRLRPVQVCYLVHVGLVHVFGLFSVLLFWSGGNCLSVLPRW